MHAKIQTYGLQRGKINQTNQWLHNEYLVRIQKNIIQTGGYTTNDHKNWGQFTLCRLLISHMIFISSLSIWPKFPHRINYFSINQVKQTILTLQLASPSKQGCQNLDFTSGRKGIAKSGLVKSQSKSKDFTQGLL